MQRNLAGMSATPKAPSRMLDRQTSWTFPAEVDLDLQTAQETLHWLRCKWLDEPLDELVHVEDARKTLKAVEERFDSAFIDTMERHWSMYEQSERLWHEVSGAESQLGFATHRLSNALRREEEARKELVEQAKRASARAQVNLLWAECYLSAVFEFM